MTRSEQESVPGSDPHALLFGDDGEPADADSGHDARPYRPTRADRRREEHERSHRRRSRRGWLIIVLTIVIVAVVGYVVVPKVFDYFRTADYSGTGASYPTVTVTVHSGDTASDIADTLAKAGVVESAKAFSEAADSNSDSQSIQPGAYNLHQHQSGDAALAALLDPTSRNASNDALVTEGANVYSVEDQLAKVFGADQRSAIKAAVAKPADVGLPVGYTTSAGDTPSSVEGFLYPATYTFEPGSKPLLALQKMVTRFVQADRSSNFAADAKTLGISPYEALTVASIIQAEAKYDEDMPKVAEVIYNRLKAHTALQIDATTKYGCEIANEANCTYNNFPTPYNSYLHDGLPPTPIDNPGAQAMAAAVSPAAGKLVFYVNGSKDGHLAFFDNEKDFETGRQKCHDNNWGCA